MDETFKVPGAINYYQESNMWLTSLTIGEGIEAVELVIGGILYRAIVENKNLKEEYMSLMQRVIEHIVTSDDPDAKVEVRVK